MQSIFCHFLDAAANCANRNYTFGDYQQAMGHEMKFRGLV